VATFEEGRRRASFSSSQLHSSSFVFRRVPVACGFNDSAIALAGVKGVVIGSATRGGAAVAGGGGDRFPNRI